MIDVFYMIDTRETPTREKTNTVAREIGDNFLTNFLHNDSVRYCGYIVKSGQFAPFWRLATVPNNMARSLHELAKHGYIGTVERCLNSY